MKRYQRNEERIAKKNLSNWSNIGQASWYVFGTLIGESITRDTRSEGAWGLRYQKIT